MDGLRLVPLDRGLMEPCIDLFIDAFTRPPWNDVYDSRQQLIDYFEGYMASNYYIGYALLDGAKPVALSVGAKKHYLNGVEYYIDQFCVSPACQGRGVGSRFLELICEDLKGRGIPHILLDTERGYPSERFYLKNGFQELEGLICLTKKV